MAMSRSDLGMVAILCAAGLGFFIFTARQNERDAKKAKEEVAQEASAPAEVAGTELPATKNTDTEPVAEVKTSLEVDTDASVEVKVPTTLVVGNAQPIPGYFPAEFTVAGVKPINLDKEKLAEVVSRYSSCTKGLVLTGHTDGVGSEKRNAYISLERAKAARKILITSGFSADKITAKGLGAETPTAPNESIEGRHFNRRVDIACVD